MTCSLPGYGASPYGSGPWGGPVFGGLPPASAEFDMFCIGPCGDMSSVGMYATTTLTGSFSSPPLSDYLQLISNNSVVSSMFLDSSVPDSYTLECTLELDSLPPTNGFQSQMHVFLGAFDDSGASVGLLLSASGIGFGTVLGEAFDQLPDGHTYVWPGGKFVFRIAVSLPNNVVFVYITEASELVGGAGHKLRYVLPVPGTAASLSEGITVSVLGTAANPSEVRVYTACLATGMQVPNRLPVADAGSYQEVPMCTFGRLDGSASYDPEGASLTYFWRLLDAPPGADAVFEGQGGFTLAGVGGFSQKLYSSELLGAHAGTPIVADDVLLIGGTPYAISTTGSDINGFYAQISTFALPENTSGIAFKLLRQAPVLPYPTQQKPTFYGDVPGLYKFGLLVNDGDLYSEEASVAVNVRESALPRGVVPDLGFMWSYLTDFWGIVENKEPITAIWGALAQIAASQLLSLWQVDYSKSLRDIQRTFQRKWMYYDLLLQEPFVELTEVTYFDTITGDLSGVDGARVGTRTYQITTDLSSYSVASGDFLLLGGAAYKIRTYAAPSPGVPNSLHTDVDLPSGVTAWRIARSVKSVSIDFYRGMATSGDTAVFEVRQIATGVALPVMTSVLAASEEVYDRLIVDPSALVAYLSDPAYAVHFAGVFRRTYVPVHERVVDIPCLQVTVPDADEEQVLHRNVDYYLGTFRGLPCLQFAAGVWQHDSGGVLVDDTTPPARLWAERTYLENLSTVERNFGTAIGLTRDDMAATQSTADYLSAVQGVWYVYLRGPTRYNLRVGMQILLGLPFAEQEGTIEELNVETVSGVARMYVRDTDETTVRMYKFPAAAGVETNPTTGQAYAIGDTVERFAPLATGVTVHDYMSDPDWFRPWLSTGAMSEVQKYFRFEVRVASGVYSLGAMSVARRHLLQFKPTYTYPVLVVDQTLDPTDIDVNDVMTMQVTLKLWEGACMANTFGVATMWDQPDPTPVKMTTAPDGAPPLYAHERLPGVYSGWKSAYDEPIHVGWHTEQQFTAAAIVGPLPPAGTGLAPDPFTAVLDTSISYMRLRGEFNGATEATPNYEMVLRVGGVEVWSSPFTIVWYSSGSLQWFDIIFHLPTPVQATAGQDIRAIIRPAVGGTNQPDWLNVSLNAWLSVGYTSPDVEWGFDEASMCPEELLEGVVMCAWAGGVPTYDTPLFAFDTEIYPASIVGDHIVLDTTSPIVWGWDTVLAPGVYGRAFVL